MFRKHLLGTILFALANTHVQTAPAGDWYVSTTGCIPPKLGTIKKPFCDIQPALDLAFPGDTVFVAAGAYAGPIFFPKKSIRVIAPDGPTLTHIVGPPDDDVVTFFDGAPADSELAGFTIREGRSGIRMSASTDTTIRNCVISDNHATDGAGVYVLGGSAAFRMCTISQNVATDNGGGVMIVGTGSPSFEFCTIEDNSAQHGAGLYASGPDAGALSGRPAFFDCIVRRNIASGAGGGMAFTGQRLIPRLDRCTISQNRAKAAAGIDFYQSGGTLSHCTIEENTADEIGGGLNCKMSAFPSFYDCIIRNNRAELYNGGAMTISALSVPHLERCEIRGNFARNGGGVYSYDQASPSFLDCAIEGNTAEKLNGINGFAGGLALGGGSPRLVRCTIRGNRADAAAGIGHTGPGGTVVNCIIEDNVAASIAGGVLSNSGALKIIGSLLHRNSSTFAGGAVYAYAAGNPRLENCTIVFNVAGTGGAVYAGNGSHPVVVNSILWRNRNGEIFADATSTVAASYSTVAGGWPGAGNSSVYPLFAFDDPAGDFRLTPQSAAINSGGPVDLDEDEARDLDGHPRVLCGQIDRGAYEFGIGDYDCDGFLEPDDFRVWAQCSTGPVQGTLGPGCEASDFDANGAIDLADYAAFQNHLARP